MAKKDPTRANGFLLSVTPPLSTVTPGAVMSYQVGLEEMSWTDPDSNWSVQWIATNDNDRMREDSWWPFHRPFFVRRFGALWPEFEWKTPGRYTIQARVWEEKTQRRTILLYRQWVEKTETVLAAELDKIEDDQVADPWAVWSKRNQELDTVLGIEKSHGVPPGKEAQHQKEVKRLRDYVTGLKDVIDRTYSCLETVPLKIVHIAKATQQKSRLNVYLARVGLKGHTWRLVDWTNPVPSKKTFKTEFEATGTGATAQEADRAAILDLISQWDSSNEYWPGTLSYEIRSGIWGDPIEDSFETDGESFWSTISRWLDWIALGAAVVAAVATLVLPVPGSRVVSAIIWTSIFSSTAAAVINIGERHDGGYGTWKDDAFDALTIVGNMFVGAGMATKWVKGAKFVNIKTLATAEKVALWGDISTAGIEGVVVGVKELQELEKIDKDPDLTPSERLHRWMAAMTRILTSSAMTTISIRSTKADLDNLNRSPSHVHADDTKPPVEKLEDVKDTGKEIEIPEHPRTEAHTDDGGQTTRVQEENARLHADAPKKIPRARYPDPPPPNSRGMRDVDHESFSEMAQKKGLWILVRDGNSEGVKFIGLPNYEGKPMTMKAKSATEGPRQGLASYHIEHKRTHKTLAEDKLFKNDPPMTKEDLGKPENRAELERRYGLWKEDNITGQGYKVDESDHFTVYKEGTDAAGDPVKIKYHGDYDLHGVYKRDGTFVEETGKVRTELNEDFGAELIRHGAHDEWEGRLSKSKGGENAGPQPGVTAYGPDGQIEHIVDRPNFKQFYQDHDFGWKERYGEWEKEAGKVPPP